MADSDPTLRLVKPLQPGDELSPAAKQSETRRLTAAPPSEDDDIFSAGADFLKNNPHAESLSKIPPALGPYHIIRPLGKGGMARVFLAEHRHLRRKVAVKILPQSMAADPVMRERFKREARVVAALDHPNIVRAYDIGESEGFQFFVMEFIAGKDLDRILRESGPLDPRLAVKYAVQAAIGLKHAHERQLIHRDVKPGNLLLDAGGTIKILDLGLARFNGELDDQLTARLDKGAVLCTPEFAAPEQLLDPDKVDQRADVYSLGATLYALLAGHSPFHGHVTEHLVAPLGREAKPLHHVLPVFPRELSLIIRRMMASDPARRPASMDEVINLLAPWCAELAYGDTIVNLAFDTVKDPSEDDFSLPPEPPSPEPVSPPPSPARPRRRRWPALVVTLGVLTVAAIGLRVCFRTPAVNDNQPAGRHATGLAEAREATRTVHSSDFQELTPGQATVGPLKPMQTVGEWPSGWKLSAGEGTTGRGGLEESAEEIQLFLETLAGERHAQLDLDHGLAAMQPGRHYRCRIDYRCPAGLQAGLFSLINSERSHVRRFPETGESWGTVEWLESPAAAARLGIGFTTWKAVRPARLEVRSVEIIEEDFDPSVGRTVFQLNPRMLLPAALRLPAGGGDVTQTGLGKFPENWTVGAASESRVSALAEVDSGLTPRAISVAEGTELLAPEPSITVTKGRVYLLRCDYRLPVGGRAVLRAGTAPGLADLAEVTLAEKNAAYVSQTYLKPARDGAVYLSFRHDVSPGLGMRVRGSLHIRSLELADVTPESLPEVVYQLEKPARGFLTKLRGEEPLEGTTPGTWPSLWIGWGRGVGTVEFQFVPPETGEIVAIRGNGSTAEMYSPRPLARLRHDRRYDVRVTYRTAGGGAGMLDIKDARNPLVRHGMSLNDTRGEWLTATQPITPDQDMAVRIAIRNDGTTPDKSLHLRELTIRDAGPKAP